MKKFLASNILAAAIVASSAHAQPVDITGGRSGAQTIHHCGFLPAGGNSGFGAANYASTPLTARLVQQKLQQLGYYRSGVDGRFGATSQAATRAFQLDYSLPVTGQVDGVTASRLAFFTHPSRGVHRCYRQANYAIR